MTWSLVHGPSLITSTLTAPFFPRRLHNALVFLLHTDSLACSLSPYRVFLSALLILLATILSFCILAFLKGVRQTPISLEPICFLRPLHKVFFLRYCMAGFLFPFSFFRLSLDVNSLGSFHFFHTISQYLNVFHHGTKAPWGEDFVSFIHGMTVLLPPRTVFGT